MLVILLDASEISQVGNVLAWKHIVLHEAGVHPFSQVSQNLLFSEVEFQLLSEEVERLEFMSASLVFNRAEDRPGRVEEDVGGELLLVLVFTHSSPVNSDDVPNSLRNRQVFKFIGE